MIATRRPLLTQIAGDLMTRALVLVPKEMSLSGAAHLLSQVQVSGAPVVDEQGRCIGVISSTDFLHYADNHRPARRCECPTFNAWQIVNPEDLPAERVVDFMNKDPVTVPPSATIVALARIMIDAHIHRVIVVDEHNRPMGIVSSTDILAAVAQADGKAL